jgi:hypothetical protein
MVGFLPFSSPIFRTAGRARELGRVEELALGDDDGAMDAAGADLAARLQAGGNRLEEAVAGFRRQRLAGQHDGGQFIVGETGGFDMRAPLLAESGAPGLG